MNSGSFLSPPLGSRAVLISTVCPRCQTIYQVQDELRGKAIRCPVPTCQHIFLVTETSPTAAPPPAPAPVPVTPPPQQSGSVGEMVPLLPTDTDSGPLVPLLSAEPIEEEPLLLEGAEQQEEQLRQPAPGATNWHEPPPVRRSDTKVP